MDGTRQDLAKEIHGIRSALKMTLKEFGLKVGVSEATVSRWEAAKHIPDREYMERIAHLQKKANQGGDRSMGRYVDLRERERITAAVSGVEDTVRIGSHQIQLLVDGAIVVNGKVRIEP